MNPTETTLEKLSPEDPDLSLEDILKEFDSPPPKPDLPQDTPVSTEVPQSAPSPLSGDTAVFTTASGDTAVFTPVSDTDAPVEPPQEESHPRNAPKAEPFSENWEPEYEEPMGEYTPKNPIPFPPKNRLRRLRQKLVAGPERRYQALAEIGLGSLQIGIFINFLLAFFSVASTVAYTLGLVDPARLRTVIFTQLLLAMLAALVGCYRLLGGLTSLFRGRFTLDTTLFVTFVACIADGLLCLSEQRLSCSSLFCLQIWMAQVAAFHRRSTEMGQMDVLRKASDLIAIVKVADFWNERPGYICAEGEPEDFLDHFRKPSTPEKALSIYALMSLLGSTVLAVAVYLMQDITAAVQIFMAAQLMALPASAFVSTSRPTHILQAQLHRRNAVLCGWQGIRAAERKTAYPVRYCDLFPADAVKMNGVKFYGAVDPGQVVACTSALLQAEESNLLTVFNQLPRSRNSSAHTVENFARCAGGIRGLVDGRSVLVGTAECMQANGIGLPEDCSADQAIFAAVDDQLSGMFAVIHSRSKAAAVGLRMLCANRAVTPVVTDCDFLLTPAFIHSKLAVQVRRLILPELDTRQALSQVTGGENATVIALTTKDSLICKACAVTGAQALKGALKAGAAIHILGGVIGLAAVAVLSLTGGSMLLTPVNLLLYTAVWSVPGLLITEFTRSL